MSNIEIINMSTDELIQDSLKIFKEKGDKEECFKRIESLNKDIKIKIQNKKEIVELNSLLEKDISQFQNAINFFSTKPKVKFSKFKTDNERIEEEKIRINEIQIIEAEAERLRLIEAQQAEAERLLFESERARLIEAEQAKQSEAVNICERNDDKWKKAIIDSPKSEQTIKMYIDGNSIHLGGMMLYNVPPDGNCFYHAFSTGLLGSCLLYTSPSPRDRG